MRFSPSGSTLRRIIDIAADALIVVLALAGVVLTLDGSTGGTAWVLAAYLALSAQLGQTRLERNPGWSPLGRAVVLRSTAIAATAVCLAPPETGTGPALVAALGAAILVGAVVVEPFVARSVRYSVPVAVRLPQVPVPKPHRDLGPLTVVLSIVAGTLGLLIALVGASPWWWVIVSGLAVVPLGVLIVQGRAKIVLARRLRTLVPEAVAAYAPDFVVYTSRPDDASYQITMWLPYLERAGLRFLIVARNAVPAQALAALSAVPVVEARGIADLDALVVPSLRAAFYVNASSGNGALVRFQHLTHIYLGHGDSDKPPSYNPTHAMYDQVFAAGPAATRRYAAHGVNIPQEKFRVVGRPQVESVLPASTSIAEVPNPVVLYAPTWRGHVEETMLYSLPSGERIVSALVQRGATVIFRPHPFSYDFPDDAAMIAKISSLLEVDAKRTGRKHLWGAAAESDRGILDCINGSDAMVSDVSSVVSDYLFSGKPFAMIAVPAEPVAFVAEFPVARASYVVRGDLADLEPQLDQMLGIDPLAEERAAIRADYLGDFPARGYASAFVDAVRQVTGKATEQMEEPEEPIAVKDDEDEKDEPSGAVEAGGDEPEGTVRRWSQYLNLVTRVGLDLAGTALALACLAAALADSSAWLPPALAAASVVAAFWSVSRTVRSPGRWSRLLTEADGTRAVLVVALSAYALQQGSLTPAYVALAAMVLIGTAVERRIRSAWTGGLLVRNLPEALQRISQIVPRGLLPLIASAVLVCGFVVLAVAGPPLIPLLAALSYFVIFLEVTARALWRVEAVERAELRLRGAIESYAPQFAVYFASTVGAGYQVGMWLPYFARIGRRFIIVTRTAPMLHAIERLCLEYELDVPIVFRPSLRSVEEIIVDSMSAAFYVNNAARNTHFVERRELTHIWLNHGDSEKPACFNPVHAIYDLIFAAGQAGIDRYGRHGVTIPPEKFKIVGRPQVERISPARAPISTIEEPTVLYAPTWQGPFADSRVYSLPIGQEIVTEALSRGARVIFRAHTFNYRYFDAREMITEIGALLDADRAATGRAHLWGPAAELEMSIEDCFNASDVMISDVSAVVSDYLHSGKPLSMVSVGRTAEQLVVEAPAARAAYVLREDLSNLVEVFDDLLGADPLAPDRQQTKVYYLGDFPVESYAEGFLQAAREVIDAGRNAVQHSGGAEDQGRAGTG